MRSRSPFAGFVPLMLAVVLAAGCAGREEESARKAIDEITAAVDAAGPDAVKYVPGKVSAVERQLVRFKVMFYDGKYEDILQATPGVLQGAKDLATEAAAKKAEIAKMLDEEWAKLTTSAPAAIEAVRARVKELKEAGKLPKGIEPSIVESAGSGIAEYEKLWKQANEAKASGNIEQAVTLGASVERRTSVMLRVLSGQAH